MSARTAVAVVVMLGWAPALLAVPAQPGVQAILHAWRGEVVYVDFWASWCDPCRQSFPWMKALERTYRSEGLRIVAIDLDHNRKEAERFLRVFRPNFKVIFDPSGNLAKRYDIVGMPTSFLIDRSGTMRFVHVGFFADQRAEYERQVRELLVQK